jgi:hypothetical protein
MPLWYLQTFSYIMFLFCSIIPKQIRCTALFVEVIPFILHCFNARMYVKKLKVLNMAPLIVWILIGKYKTMVNTSPV